MCITLFHIHDESILAEKNIHVCFCIWQILVLWQLEKIILSCIYPLKKIKNLEFSLTSKLFIYLSNQYHICITCILTTTECWMLKIPFVKSSQIINEWFIGLNWEKTPPLKKSKCQKIRWFICSSYWLYSISPVCFTPQNIPLRFQVYILKCSNPFGIEVNVYFILSNDLCFTIFGVWLSFRKSYI